MNHEEMYELVYDAVRSALRAEAGGGDAALLRRMEHGSVVFRDDQQKVVKELDVFVVFRKITAVRDRLRVLEQKINAHPALSGADKAEMQALITQAQGSLTTFNFLFAEPGDKFVGQGAKD